ncbi:hypothetical protein D5086_032215 [Populus alba]|uniref:Uncharacterized protein n=1 Tax=Populus alba TaxID=43335 RepID=A0ACC4AKR4_POPAL
MKRASLFNNDSAFKLLMDIDHLLGLELILPVVEEELVFEAICGVEMKGENMLKSHKKRKGEVTMNVRMASCLKGNTVEQRAEKGRQNQQTRLSLLLLAVGIVKKYVARNESSYLSLKDFVAGETRGFGIAKAMK